MQQGNLRELVRLVNEEMDSASHDYKERLELLERDLADVHRRLDRLYDALEGGKVCQ